MENYVGSVAGWLVASFVLVFYGPPNLGASPASCAISNFEAPLILLVPFRTSLSSDGRHSNQRFVLGPLHFVNVTGTTKISLLILG